ncbi:MAG TPA: hypothetical protein VK030_07425, partial [Actinomycetales bacterium]|nr:hypothetical protein [Actinomycetales bacterium]
TVVKWGEKPRAALVTKFDGDRGKTIRTEVDPHRLRRHVTELAGEAGFLGNLHAEVELPRRVLAEGITFVDTPGVGRAQARAATNLTLLPAADIAIMVSDVTQELTEPELNFLKQARTLCPRIACVVSKNDLQHHWRGIADANREHLTAAGIDIPVIPTSALLHHISERDQDADLRREGRIDELANYLLRDVRRDVIAERHRTVVEDICSVGEHLAMAIEAELQTLEAPDDGERVVQSLESAKDQADRLAKRSARWQQTLSDGFGELISDIEFDLRDRLRDVGREAEQLIDESDPGRSWEEIGAWLAESLTQAVSDNFVWAHERSSHLAEVVAEHFSIDGNATIPNLPFTGAEQAISAIGGLESVRSGRLTIGQKLMVGMRGSYGGVLMFGLMTTLAGMALVNPISIAAGLVMGGVAYRQDMSQRLDQRRAEAKHAVRRLIDESIFKISKESRDRTTRVKRILRDHFITVAEELKHSLNESVRRAQSGTKVSEVDRSPRTVAVTNELKEIRQLTQRAKQLVSVSPVVRLERRSA